MSLVQAMEEGFKGCTLLVGYCFAGHILMFSVFVIGVLYIRDVDLEFLSPVVLKVLHSE
jgi:hypothetical protein